VITLYASHDHAARLRVGRRGIAIPTAHWQRRRTAALNEGRCLLAGFHALTAAPLRSPTAGVYRPMPKPGRHKPIGFAQRNQV
jgi:putative molybdopterin biosynthesis protein